ncbi:Chd6 [Nucleospora cyclopteri]
MIQQETENNEPRGRGRPRKNQPSFSFRLPVYNSPLGYQYSLPIFYSVNIPMPPRQPPHGSHSVPRSEKKMITEEDYISEPRKTRNAAIKGVQMYKKKKRQFESDSETHSDLTTETQVEEDPYEKLLDKKDGQFLVKFRNKSYLHCDWVDESELMQTRVGAMKVKKFKKVVVDEDFTTVERILTDGYDDNKYTILVKWKKLPYELATIELAENVENCKGYEEELEKYKERKKMRHTRWPLEWRPDKNKVNKLDNSPEFKNKNKLREYQLEGLNWLINRWMWRQSCIMADEMGLGKTVQSVAFVNSLSIHFDYNHPVLIVAPLSTIVHWEREFAGWTNLRVLTYHGSIQGREIIKDYEFSVKTGNIDVRLFDVILTTYEMAMAGNEHLAQFEYCVAIIDEAHRLKNPNSKASLALKNLSIMHKVLLTGTPIQNNLNELWALFNFIDPNRFFSLENFLNEYKMESPADVERLQSLLKPLMLRRMKEDVETSIPNKEETIIEVELTMTQKRYYRAILEKNIEFLQSGEKGNMPNLINAMMELRKCCIHPYLLKGAEESIVADFLYRKNESKLYDYIMSGKNQDMYYRILIQSSGKLVLLDKLLMKLQGKHKVLIFSQMTKCLDLLAEYLNYRQFKYERIDGGVRGDLRQAAIDRFSTGDAFVFLLCTKAGGVGINLTAADTCVIFDSDWNPQNDLQAQARCHRIGQKNAVKIYRLVTKNSYEREMFDRAGMKLGLDRAILQRMHFDTSKKKEEKVNKGEAIQLLLRKGAYGVLMDNDDSGDKFCEEDIDQILERRTRVIKHEDGGNVFSKATFQVEEEVDDPYFWENLLNAKKTEEKESRIKRQCRKLARDGSVTNPDELRDLLNFYTGQLSSKKYPSLSGEEKNLFVLFLEILVNGFKNLKLSLFNKGEISKEDSDKFRVRQLYKYCLDMVQNEKSKLDFLELMNEFNAVYDVDLFEKQSNVYLKYYEQFLFRIQIPVIMNTLVDQVYSVEKGRGFSHEDDLEIAKKVCSLGYGTFTIKGKTADEVNQRVRKMLTILYHKKEIKDNDNLYFKAILNFGRVTELNKEYVEKFINRDTKNLEDLIIKICKMSKRSRKDTPEADCYDRIVFFDKLEAIDEFSNNLRRGIMPKNWSNKKDEELRDFLLVEGFSRVYEEFNITEDIVFKRFEQIFRLN